MTAYEQNQAFGGVIDVLEAVGANYAIWGGLAVVVAKLRAYKDSESTRHLEDVASIIRLQGGRLNRGQLETTAGQLGLLGVWQALWEQNRPGAAPDQLDAEEGVK